MLELLFDRLPELRRFSLTLAEQLDAWMSTVPDRASLLHEDWIAGPRGASGSSEVLGSLGIRLVRPVSTSDDWARKKAYSALLRAVILSELGQGVPAGDLERKWNLRQLKAMEERWRDERLWLLAGLAEVLNLRCYYFHLLEECGADRERVRWVKAMLLRMRA